MPLQNRNRYLVAGKEGKRKYYKWHLVVGLYRICEPIEETEKKERAKQKRRKKEQAKRRKREGW